MTYFKNLRIGIKLNLGFGIVLLFIAGLGLFSVFQLSLVSRSSSEIATRMLPSVQNLSQMGLAMSRTRSLDLQHLLNEDRDELLAIEKSAESQLGQLQDHLNQFRRSGSLPREAALLPEIEADIRTFSSAHVKIMELARNEKIKEAKQILKEQSGPAFRRTVAHIDELIVLNNKEAARASQAAIDAYTDSKIMVLIVLGCSVLASMGISVFLARLISQPLAEAVRFAEEISLGHLNGTIRVTANDETGKLSNALLSMNCNLRSIVEKVREGIQVIHTSASEIATGNLDLSARTEQQAGALEETASAMEEMTSTVQQNAGNANEANKLAANAAEVARTGGVVVNSVVSTMQEISTSALKIGNIVSVIDGIAFQTNLLALNAAVEAARAGEQGRGFAVVASEVRALAQRSASAAKEISTLIQTSLAKVNIGNDLALQAGTTMQDVVASVERMTSIVAEITAASYEQQQGIEQINCALTDMDEGTQQNAALVEQAAATAGLLKNQAASLSDTFEFFERVSAKEK